MKEKSKLIRWIKKNRKVLTAAGISIGLIIGIALGLKNADELKALWTSLQNTPATPVKTATKPSTPVITEQTAAAVTRNSCAVPFDVSAHLRTLPEGWHASADKVATALDNGFVLKEGQTWVETFTKGNAA